MMLPPPRRKSALAVIAFFTQIIIHPVILRESCGFHQHDTWRHWVQDQPSPRNRRISFEAEPNRFRLLLVRMLLVSSCIGKPGMLVDASWSTTARFVRSPL